jgi:hypothetical protein
VPGTAVALVAGLLFAGAAVAFAIARQDRRQVPVVRTASGSPTARPPSAAPSLSVSPTPSINPPSPIPGYLMIADRANDRLVLVDSNKPVLWTYPPAGSKPAMPFFFDDDVFFNQDHTEVISQQEEQQTIQILSFPAGKLLWRYGHVNVRGSTPGYLSTPDDAYLLPDGTVSVADVRNCRVLFISPAHEVLRQLGTTGICSHHPPDHLASPNGDTPLPDGGTLVTEINGSWIDDISADGRLVWSVHAPVAYPSDAQWLGHGKILLADYSSPGHVLEMTTSGKVLWKYGPPSGPGALNHPSLALMLPNGLIAVNDDFRDRVVLIDPAKNRIVWQYGHTDAPGTVPGFLHVPDGMDFLPFDVAMSTPAIARLVGSPAP